MSLAPSQLLSLSPQRDRTLDRVEIEDVAPPRVSQHALGLAGHDLGSRGDDENVVGQLGAASQDDLAALGVDAVDSLLQVSNALRNERGLRPGNVPLVVRPEGNEQEPGLVVVGRVLIDDRQRPFLLVEPPDEMVGHHGAGCAGAQYHELLHGGVSPMRTASRESRSSQRVCGREGGR